MPMTRWIVLFRGINVGGRGLLPMKELVAVLKDQGYADVRTYIQSGNVVLRSRESRPERVSARIAKAVSESHGFRPAVLTLGADDMRQAAEANPFPKAQNDPKSLHLFFLAESPKRPDLGALEALKSATESFALADKVLYLHAPDGIARSKLAARAERLLGVDATARNWRTVTKVLELASEPD